MGTVWRARDEVLHRDIALKEIRLPPQLDAVELDTLRRRALREARTAARLNHPNIVAMYDVLQEDGRPWIVMQLVPHRSLTEAVQADGPLSPSQGAQIGLQVLAALRSAHESGVLHRDVKPGNVLLGPGNQAVLTDFGMAIADGSPTLTTSGVLIGSPSYMAPERARGAPATPAADLWALGATLYAAVEGRPPFDRDTTIAVLTAVVSDDPDPPDRAGPLWPVISGLLRKDPGTRLRPAQVERLLSRIAAGGAAGWDGPLDEPTSPLGEAGRTGGGPPLARGDHLPPAPSSASRPEPVAAAAIGPDEPLAGSHDEPRAGTQGAVAGSQDTAPGRSVWRLAAVIAVAAVVATAAIAAAISVASEGTPGHRAATTAPKRTSAAHAAARPSAVPSPRPSGPAAAPPGSGSAALPAGFVWYHDPNGFSIGVPGGWQVSHQGQVVYLRDPAGGRFLLIDQSNHPKPDPVADWRQQEANRIGTYPGYHRIRLEAVHYAQAQQAADWEFTYYQGGQLVHVLNRNILANADHAYALYWSTPAGQWAASFRLFEAFAATFRPAGA